MYKFVFLSVLRVVINYRRTIFDNVYKYIYWYSISRYINIKVEDFQINRFAFFVKEKMICNFGEAILAVNTTIRLGYEMYIKVD